MTSNTFAPEDFASTEPFDQSEFVEALVGPSEPSTVVRREDRVAALEKALRDLLDNCRDERQMETSERQAAWWRARRLVR